MDLPLEAEVMVHKETMQEQLVHKVVGHAVDLEAEKERERKLHEENPITHTTMTPEQEDVKTHVQEDLLRKVNAHMADMMEDEEKERRILEEKMHEVQEEVVRRVSLKETHRMEEMARDEMLHTDLPPEVKDRKKSIEQDLVEHVHVGAA
eukprot:comp5194_c0_seq1/m.1236 comp5194_c0_seq1/g.1236  ORF comp5194_c0_seq1/g.1236 comp5194_c0_seq1/m.1236 type:complete len:150 (-) comp5194_c0_seq1:357-806(-)